jgi:hypothetical protein
MNFLYMIVAEIFDHNGVKEFHEDNTPTPESPKEDESTEEEKNNG